MCMNLKDRKLSQFSKPHGLAEKQLTFLYPKENLGFPPNPSKTSLLVPGRLFKLLAQNRFPKGSCKHQWKAMVLIVISYKGIHILFIRNYIFIYLVKVP